MDYTNAAELVARLKAEGKLPPKPLVKGPFAGAVGNIEGEDSSLQQTPVKEQLQPGRSLDK